MAEEPAAGAGGVTTWLVADQIWEHDEEVQLDHTEIILVLSGTGQLQVDGGQPLDLAPGRAARIDAGAHTRWMVDQEFTELWLYV